MREGERSVSHEREESNNKVKGGNERTNNTESTDRGARGKEGPNERGEWRERNNSLNRVLEEQGGRREEIGQGRGEASGKKTVTLDRA